MLLRQFSYFTTSGRVSPLPLKGRLLFFHRKYKILTMSNERKSPAHKGRKVGGHSSQSKSKNEDTDTATNTQHTNTQALDEDAKKALEKDVETAKSLDPIFVTIRGNAQGKKHTI